MITTGPEADFGPPEPVRTSFFLILVFISALQSCKLRKESESGNGISLQNDRIVWTVSAGVLLDEDFPRIDRFQAENLLNQGARQLENSFPEVKINILLDQPLDGPFIMERITRKKTAIFAKNNPLEPVLLLDSSDASRRLNEQKLSKTNLALPQREQILKHLERLQQIRQGNHPLLDEKMTASMAFWNDFFANQVRYDIIITNALIFPDDLRLNVDSSNSDGGSALSFFSSPGTTGLEGRSALVSNYRMKEAELVSLISRGFFSLLYQMNGSPEYRKARESFFRALYHRNNGDLSAACREMKQISVTDKTGTFIQSLELLRKSCPDR